MAAKINFNGTNIEVAELGEIPYFASKDIAEAIGLTNSPRVAENAVPIIIGNRRYYQLRAMEPGLRSTSGERNIQAIALLHKIHERYPQAMVSEPATAAHSPAVSEWMAAQTEVNNAESALAAAESALSAAKDREQGAWAAVNDYREGKDNG